MSPETRNDTILVLLGLLGGAGLAAVFALVWVVGAIVTWWFT